MRQPNSSYLASQNFELSNLNSPNQQASSCDDSGKASATNALCRYERTGRILNAQIVVTDADLTYAAKLLRGWRPTLRAGDSLHLAIAAKREASIYTFDHGMNNSGSVLGVPVVLLQVE